MFKLDSPLMSFLSKVADIMILNILIIVFCIPIVTAGASITAAYTIAYKMVKNEESYIIRGFWKAFKENFKQSTIIWIIFLIVFAFLFADYRIMFYSGMEVGSGVTYGVIAVTVIIGSGFSFVFPLQARFTNTVKNTIKNAFLIALCHLPYAIIFVISYVIPFLILYFVPQSAPLIVLLSFGLLPYLKSFLFLKIFKRYEVIPETEVEKDDSQGEGLFSVSDAMEKESENTKLKK